MEVDASAVDLKEWLLARSGARRIGPEQRLQSLWGGYGRIARFALEGATEASVVLKVVEPPPPPPAGEELRSHERKLRSYAVEQCFYEEHAAAVPAEAAVPAYLGATQRGAVRWLLLGDLRARGFEPSRPRAPLPACLRWLASFHAYGLGASSRGLWERGSYWHLSTRPDELARIEDRDIASRAAAWDQLLAATEFPTLLHGDAKLENFCFSADGTRAAAVDYQYIGPGPGIVDVAYLLSSALSPRDCHAHAEPCLALYFVELRRALGPARALLATRLEADWRRLWPVAWADFYRFLLGWSPALARSESYAQSQVALLVDG